MPSVLQGDIHVGHDHRFSMNDLDEGLSWDERNARPVSFYSFSRIS